MKYNPHFIFHFVFDSETFQRRYISLRWSWQFNAVDIERMETFDTKKHSYAYTNGEPRKRHFLGNDCSNITWIPMARTYNESNHISFNLKYLFGAQTYQTFRAMRSVLLCDKNESDCFGNTNDFETNGVLYQPFSYGDGVYQRGSWTDWWPIALSSDNVYVVHFEVFVDRESINCSPGM
jgi:hypothetical protein